VASIVRITPVGGAEARSAAQGTALEVVCGLVKDVLVGTGAGKVNEDSTHGYFDVRTDLQGFQTDGSARGLGQARTFLRYRAIWPFSPSALPPEMPSKR